MQQSCSPPQIDCKKGRWFRRLAISLLVGSILQNPISAFAQSVTLSNQAKYTYGDTDSRNTNTYTGASNQVDLTFTPLIDPFGQITTCGGKPLESYDGFSVALYDPDPNDSTGTELGNLLPLTRTELPDIPGNGIPKGITPNRENVNPYFLNDESGGGYSFLFDPNRDQVRIGRTYILVVTPPPNPFITDLRVKIEITNVIQTDERTIVQYIATSLSGFPISRNGDNQISREVFVEDADNEGIGLQISLAQCQARQIVIAKTGDRATVQPGDVVTYRLTIRNIAQEPLKESNITDNLPVGFEFLPSSVRAELNDESVDITTNVNGQQVTFISPVSIPPEQILNVVYAARITPDAARGSGVNSVTVTSKRDDNNVVVRDGPSTHRLKIRDGIIADYGTIIGRVFVDKNFDGEQQPGEPGVPNAVIFMDDGNRVITDVNGLFSIANVLPGPHTGVLDLYSLPGYTLAPNLYFKERNSQSRLVRLQPGGMVRMNFAVTPTFAEEAQKEEAK